MSIEDSAKDTKDDLTATAGELSEKSADRHNTGNTKQLDPQANHDAEELNSPARDAVVTIKEKSKDFKENPTPSFQEIESPDPTLASTSDKADELKSELAAKAEQMMAPSKDNSKQKHSSTKLE